MENTDRNTIRVKAIQRFEVGDRVLLPGDEVLLGGALAQEKIKSGLAVKSKNQVVKPKKLKARKKKKVKNGND